VIDGGGDEVMGFEDLEIASGVVVALGAVDDGLGGGVPGDFLQGEGVAEEILGQALAAGVVVGGHGMFAAVVDVEAGVFLGEEVGKFAGADLRLRCWSEQREHENKETDASLREKFEGKLAQLAKGLPKPRCTKKRDKIYERIGRLKQRYQRVGQQRSGNR